jgi:2-iminobutanoate/2-iminopropanoate deaminase
MTRSIILTKQAPAPIGPYSQGIVAKGSFLFSAGQVALDPSTGQLVAGDVKTQTRQVMNNLRAVLQEAGSSMDRVVKTTVYLKDMNEFSMMNEVYGEFFPANPPARSTVEVARLPKDARVEIDVVALIEPV